MTINHVRNCFPMKEPGQIFLAVSALFALITGCESIDTSVFGGSFGRNSTAMTAGGAVAGQDYVIGLKPSEAAQQYFASASASDAKPVTVTPGDDKGTGVTWTDDGGITIPPGVTIEFVNKGCCLDPHLPAPKADEEMQFIKTSCLIPTQLQGTYKNLLRRAAAGWLWRSYDKYILEYGFKKNYDESIYEKRGKRFK